jgi:hypothetical protein
MGTCLSLSDAGKRVEKSIEGFKMVLDQRVTVTNDVRRTTQLPDIIVIDDKKRLISVLEIAVSAEDLIEFKEVAKK